MIFFGPTSLGGTVALIILAIVFAQKFKKATIHIVVFVLLCILAISISECIGHEDNESKSALLEKEDEELPDPTALVTYHISERILDSIGYKIRPSVVYRDVQTEDGWRSCGIAQLDKKIVLFNIYYVGDTINYKYDGAVIYSTDPSQIIFDDESHGWYGL